MKVLLINKFLYPNGGSEKYIFELGAYMQSKGVDVQYFGMEHPGRIVGNRVEAYTSNMDFHGGSKLDKILYPVKTVYSKEARQRIRTVLDDFQPDVCHLNNFNYQLTPSIILEIVKWRNETGKSCKIIYTAHDLQIVCPNHLMLNPITGETCDKCLGGKFLNCVLGKCIHGSLVKSAVGAVEAFLWNRIKVYRYFDAVICPSRFLADKLSTNPILKNKIVVLHNFINTIKQINAEKKDYVLFYGRYSKEKGIETLLEVVDELPDVKFVFAGDGSLKNEIEKRNNIENKGFLSGDELINTISCARFTVVPSECYENCPFTVMESQMCGTPVLGADIGGIPELLLAGKTGELFESGNTSALKNAISDLFYNDKKIIEYTNNCKSVSFDSIEKYFEKLIKIYN